MTINKIVNRINQRMNFDNFPYADLHVALDAAIDRINTEWRINLPVISDLPQTSPGVLESGAPSGTLVETEYPNMPDDMVRGYLVPFVAGQQYMINEQDGSPEMQEALLNLSKLTERYGYVAGSGLATITAPNFNLLVEDTTDQFGDGHNNYDYPHGTSSYSDEELALNPLVDLED